MACLFLLCLLVRAALCVDEGSVAEEPSVFLQTALKAHDRSQKTSSRNIEVECDPDAITIQLRGTRNFNGMIYPKGLSTNSSCMMQYSKGISDSLVYKLPLRSCNTMSTDVRGGVEYFNTVIIEPHRKVVTSRGKGFHIRCKYHTLHNHTYAFEARAVDKAERPDVHMRIYVGNSEKQVVAENVKIGDPLTLSVGIEPNSMYGIRVTNCVVRDGFNWGAQPLVNNEGCPIDKEIMPGFEYSDGTSKATSTFLAHKFPYTKSVYYQCHVRLCHKPSGGCDDVPPTCDGLRPDRRDRGRMPRSLSRSIRDVEEIKAIEIGDKSTEVFSGLYVNEPSDVERERKSVLQARIKPESRPHMSASLRSSDYKDGPNSHTAFEEISVCAGRIGVLLLSVIDSWRP
ncbi:cuticlin-1-like isoform X2 [Varroa destructor]|uniref:ZP domain-containing protein n=1 Tax=Varroa destructor TaxID=109461 RepID=A0A7M7J9G9_VARDE|nr:cuticlin-1-like isoform X2 [Varroa destructor]XP_022646452.1 cuticlin-1-like isoform X2 [Varroa destructor]XP_022646453.1 cuticlin-1-like isoform X2 [Varroa destructor]XP_022646454.1 cuticlin-1-like isoform X2 [Varroa destructor]